MPRWPVRASPESSGSQRYFPRRRAPVKVRPASRSSKSRGPASWRRTARGCSTCTEATVRPTTPRSRPSRTTSTSGSSGTGRQAPPGRLCRLLLGLLLAPAAALAVQLPADHRGRGEGLGVIGTALADDVLRHAQAPGGGELL